MIVKELEEKGHLVKIEEIQNNVGFSERTDAVIEPRLSRQWFCKMNEMALPALEGVMADDVELYPAKFKNVYRHWMENIREWCISRQLWWGHRIPAYYINDEEYVVAETPEEALEKAIAKTGNAKLTINDLKQDEDVLDTWFSSWLWPIAVFNGIMEPNNGYIRYYYPTNLLVSGHDIIFFWIARMIMAGYEYRYFEPFHEVYFTGMVRDKQGRKMSKQLGNSPDLLGLIDKYGADAIRFGVLVSSPAGNDLLFDEKLCEQGRNFANKMWNAMRLVKGWESGEMIRHKSSRFNEKPVTWFQNKLNHVVKEIDDYLDDFRLSEALTVIYKLVWDDFCSTYLEMIKPSQEIGMDEVTYQKTLDFFETLVKLIHPFMPFISEEIWQTLRVRESDDYCMVAEYPKGVKADMETIRNTERIIETISWVRYHRNEAGLSPKVSLDLYIKSANTMLYRQWEPIIRKMANIKTLNFVNETIDGAKSFTIKTDEFYIPQEKVVDIEGEKIKLKEELEYTKGFLNTVLAKLNNERFVQNARPDILEKEQAKKDDAETKIRQLEENLARFN